LKKHAFVIICYIKFAIIGKLDEREKLPRLSPCHHNCGSFYLPVIASNFHADNHTAAFVYPVLALVLFTTLAEANFKAKRPSTSHKL